MNLKYKINQGDRFGLLTVMKFIGLFPIRKNKKRGEIYLCKCDCGKEINMSRENLISGNKRSCGCLQNIYSIYRFTKHGMVHHKFYYRWYTIKNRCSNPKFACYKYYGGRGIKMYDKWVNDAGAFISYIEHLDNYGVDGMTIDRINNDGNYEPGNLRLVSRAVRARNKRIKSSNKTGYVGISLYRNGKYKTRITVSGEQIFLGHFNKIKDAVDARNQYIIDNNLQDIGFNLQPYKIAVDEIYKQNNQ